MSAQEPVIAVSNETSESERVGSSPVPPSEHQAAKDISLIADPLTTEPVTESPAEAVRTASDDTPFIPPTDDTNIPAAAPTSLNGPANGIEAPAFVNESDNTIVPVEIRKVEDAGEVVEDKAPIKHGVNGDVEGTTVAGSEGADLDLADQTLVGDLSHDADTPVVREVADVPVKGLDVNAEWKVVVEDEDEDEGDKAPEPVAVLVKDVEGDEVSEVTPAPEVVESIPVPVVASVPTPPSDAFLKESEPTPAEPVIGDLDAAREVEPHAAELEVAPEPIETVTVIKEDPEHVHDEPARVEEPVAELEASPAVEEQVAKAEVPPVAVGPNVEEEPVKGPAVEVTEVPPVLKEDAPAPAPNGRGHPDEELVEPAERAPEVSIPEESTPSIHETSAPGDVEPKVEELPTAGGEVEPVTKEPEEANPPVQDEKVSPGVEDIASTTDTPESGPAEEVDVVEPKSVDEVEVTGPENPERSLPVEEPPASGLDLEPSIEVKEVPVDAEPVIATPISTFAVPEHIMEPVVDGETPAVEPVEDVTPDAATQDKPTVDDLEVLKAGEPALVVATPVEEPEPSPEVVEQAVFAVPEPTVEPTAEEKLAPGVLEPEVPAPEPVLEEVPPVEFELVIEPQEPEVVPPPVPSEEKASIGEAEPEEAVEAGQDVPTSDVPQEETKQVEGPWTPSYSVSSQGGLDAAPPADEDVESTIAPEPPVEEPVAESGPVPEVAAPDEEPTVAADDVQKSPSWTPSYSTTIQGSSPRVESQAILESEPELVPAEPATAPEDISTTVQEAEPEPVSTELAVVPEQVVEETVPQIISPPEEPAAVEAGIVSEDVPEPRSWTPSYSTTVQGSSPRLESEAILEDESKLLPSKPVASGDVPTTTQEAEPVPAPAEPTVTEDTQPMDETPAIDAPSEEPSDLFDPSLGQARLAQPVEPETERPKSPWTPSYAVTTLPGSGSSPRVDSKSELDETPAVEAEAEVPPVEKVEVTETPKIVTPADEEPPEPATTETHWAQSYSVTSQPGSPRISPKADLGEFEPELQSIEHVQETPVVAPIVDLANVPKTVVEDENGPVAEPVSEEESKPAWAQSYSVTSQPGSPRVSPKQVPEEIPEVEEVEPSWTRSYSVTSQLGSPRLSPKEDLPEPSVESVIATDEPTTVVTPPVEEVTSAPVEAEAPERPKSPWTPSYSVTTLEGQTEQAPPEDVEPESEVMSIPKTFVEETPEPKPEIDAPVPDVPFTEPLTVKDEQPERPKSPWTPSYSVTTLPGSVPAEEPKLDSVAGKSLVDTEAPKPEAVEAAEAVDDQLEENGTTSDVFEVHEAVAQPAVRDEPQADAKTTEPAPLQLDLPKPDVTAEVEEKSSWTPSYSVTQLSGASPKLEMKEGPSASQDTPTVDEITTKEIESASLPVPQEAPQRPWSPSYATHTQGTTAEADKEGGSHYFPGVPESLDEAPERPKLDLLISTDPSNISKVSPRGRYESSTSSRLFPGAWFSSPKSPGDEIRTSMDSATGEFILSRSSVPPNEPAVAEAPEDLPASPIITPATPTTKKDKKWRMCEIM